jgi:hypothetical protein
VINDPHYTGVGRLLARSLLMNPKYKSHPDHQTYADIIMSPLHNAIAKMGFDPFLSIDNKTHLLAERVEKK